MPFQQPGLVENEQVRLLCAAKGKGVVAIMGHVRRVLAKSAAQKIAKRLILCYD